MVNRLVVICKAVLRSYIFCIFTRGQRQLLNLDGLGRAVQEVSLYLLSGAALHAVLCGLKVSYNQNVVGRRLGLLGIYNVIANDSKVIGAARLDGSSIVCYVGSTVGSNLVPSIVYLNLNRRRGLDRGNLSGSYVNLCNSSIGRSSVGLISNNGPVILSIAFVDVEILDVLGTNLVANGDGLGACVGNLTYGSRGNNYGINLVVAVGINQLNSASNLIDCGSLLKVSQSVGASSISYYNINSLLNIVQLVLSAVQLGLLVVARNSFQLTNSTSSNYLGIIISIYAINILVAIGLNANQNLNIQTNQVRNIGRNLGESLRLQSILIGYVASQLNLIGVLTRGLLNRSQLSSSGLIQIHVLLADSLLARNIGSILKVVDIVRPYYTLHVQCVVQNLCSVLTRQSSVQISINILEQVVQLAVLHGVLSPSCTSQASLLSIVASSYQYHLCSLKTGYGIVRSKLGSRLTSDDASVLQVTYVTLSPSCGRQIGERSREGCVSAGVVITAIHDREDHLCHLSTGNGGVRLEGAVIVTLDYAQRREHVYSGGGLDVSLIAVRRRTSEHSERASERQHQCENLFEVAYEKLKIDTKSHPRRKSMRHENIFVICKFNNMHHIMDNNIRYILLSM